MIEVNTIPNKNTLNVSKVAINLNSAAEFSMQFSVAGFGKYADAEGNVNWGPNPLVSTLLNITAKNWSDWGKTEAQTDEDYIIDLALKQLGLTRAPAEEAPAEEAPAPKKKAAKKKAAPKAEEEPAE